LAITRRTMLGGSALLGLMGTGAARAAFDPSPFFSGRAEDHGFTYNRSNVAALDPVWQRQLVEHEHHESPGTVIVDTQNHFLYVTFENNTALRYGGGVGLEGFKWFGRATVATLSAGDMVPATRGEENGFWRSRAARCWAAVPCWA
jgi:lipoprotein-anchoring transpeptidase ErfK/SrfK